MISAADRLYLRAAVELAERGLYTCTPNPRVGCLLVRDGAVTRARLAYVARPGTRGGQRAGRRR